MHFKMERILLVDKNVNEKQACFVEPRGYSLEERLVVFHVFQHFDADNAVKRLFALF